MADANPVLQAASRFSAVNRAGTVDVIDSLRQQFSLYDTIGKNYQAAGEAAATVETAKQKGELETQAARDLAAATLGTDMRENTQRLTEANAGLLQSLAVRDSALAAVNEKQRVGLFDNPLQWLLNQITVNDDIAKFNAANAEVDVNAERIKRLTDATNAEAITQNQLRHTTSQAASVAAAQQLKLQADSQAATARIKGFEVNAAGVERAIKASNDELNAQNVAYHAVLAQEAGGRANEELALSRERAQFAREEWKFRQDQIEQALKTKKDVEAAKQELLDTVNIGLKAIGAQPIDNPNTIARFMLQAEKTGEVPKEFLDAFSRGRKSLMKGDKVIASDPTDLLEILTTTGMKWEPVQAPVQAALKESLQQLNAEVLSPAGIPGTGGKKDKTTATQRFNQIVQDTFSGYRAKIVPGDKDNPYNIGAVSDILQLDAIKSLPVVAKVLIPLTATPEGARALDDPQVLTGAVVNALVTGQITYNEAVQLPAIYQRGNAINNAARQFEALGLPKNETYNAKFPVSGTVDLANEASWARYLNKNMAASLVHGLTGMP